MARPCDDRARGSAGLLSAKSPTAGRDVPCEVAVEEALADRWVDAWLAALRAAGASDATVRRRAEALARAVTPGPRDREAERAETTFARWVAAHPAVMGCGVGTPTGVATKTRRATAPGQDLPSGST